MKLLTSFLAVALLGSAAEGAIVTYNFSREFSGGTAPVGSPDWLSVKFDDAGSTGSVAMTVTATNLTASEFLRKLLLNLDPTLNPTQLTFAAPTKVGVFADPVVSKGTNSFSAGGGSNFDVEILFDNAPQTNRFGTSEIMSTVISGIPSLNASSFSFNSTGGSGPQSIAAHVQGIGQNGEFSGWLTTAVPEPMSLSLFAGLGAMLRRKR